MSDLIRTPSASKSMFVNACTTDIRENYELQEKIDQGCSGQVYKAIIKQSSSDPLSYPDQNPVRAIKRIEKKF